MRRRSLQILITFPFCNPGCLPAFELTLRKICRKMCRKTSKVADGKASVQFHFPRDFLLLSFANMTLIFLPKNVGVLFVSSIVLLIWNKALKTTGMKLMQSYGHRGSSLAVKDEKTRWKTFCFQTKKLETAEKKVSYLSRCGKGEKFSENFFITLLSRCYSSPPIVRTINWKPNIQTNRLDK